MYQSVTHTRGCTAMNRTDTRQIPEESYYKELEEHGFSFFLSIDENGYSEDVTIGSYPFGYGALYLYKHCTTNEIIAGFWQCS